MQVSHIAEELDALTKFLTASIALSFLSSVGLL
jgi:hypothetical protein